MTPPLRTAGWARSFRREAEIGRLLDHPGIVKTFDAAEIAWDLEHLEQVGTEQRGQPPIHHAGNRSLAQRLNRRVLLYAGLVLLPLALFGLMLALPIIDPIHHQSGEPFDCRIAVAQRSSLLRRERQQGVDLREWQEGKSSAEVQNGAGGWCDGRAARRLPTGRQSVLRRMRQARRVGIGAGDWQKQGAGW